MLVLAFPREKLEERLLGGKNADGLTIAYLEAWLRVDPDNAEVLSELPRAYQTAQRDADAGRILARLSLSRDPAARQSALAMRISLAEQRLYALKKNDPARGARLRELDAVLHEARAYRWDNEQLGLLARQARALNDNELAAHYYAQLADSDPSHSGDWLVALAQTQLGSGQYVAAANALFKGSSARDESRSTSHAVPGRAARVAGG